MVGSAPPEVRTVSERLVAEWSESPFTSIKRRGATVQHRVVVESHGQVGADVRHEVRCLDLDGYPGEWTAAEVYEVRPQGVEKITAESGWWT